VTTDAALVRRLVAAQFPQWAGLPIETIGGDGMDNAMYRLGDDLAVRLPRRPGAAQTIQTEGLWLPRLAPRLPLPVPLPLARGEPGEGYPWSWSVCRWLEGEHPAPGGGDTDRLAGDLAGFVRALQAVDATNAPGAGRRNHGRGAPLSHWRGIMDERLGWLADLGDIEATRTAWEADSAVPAWAGPPMFIHGDLNPGNLLTREGRLSGVIDWSYLGAGDPACDLQIAWTLFDRRGREAFRAAMAVDDATWRRGRAWGLAVGILNLSYYRTRHPGIAAQGRRAIDAVLADVA
jgi:aminoglycoside phosphotransferase (APT) family kinase protein